MSDQDPRASVKCRVCDKRYVDMYSPFLGFCPACGARHAIVVTPKEELDFEFHMKTVAQQTHNVDCSEQIKEFSEDSSKNAY